MVWAAQASMYYPLSFFSKVALRHFFRFTLQLYHIRSKHSTLKTSRVMVIDEISGIGTRVVGEVVNRLGWTPDEKQDHVFQQVDEFD